MRRTALWVYVGPLIVITVIVGIALLYWATRGPAPNEDVTNTIGTVGDDSTCSSHLSGLLPLEVLARRLGELAQIGSFGESHHELTDWQARAAFELGGEPH